MQKVLRTFIAVSIPETHRQLIASFQSNLKRCGADVRWVRPEAMHLTLRFLGDLTEDQVQTVITAVRIAAEGTASFPLVIEGTGGFPNVARPRVLWLGVMTGSQAISDLAGRIQVKLDAAGFPPEKRSFSPHLTLGRVRSLRNIRKTVETMQAHSFSAEPFEVDAVRVIRSDLKPSGAVYTTLESISLQRI